MKRTKLEARTVRSGSREPGRTANDRPVARNRAPEVSIPILVTMSSHPSGSPAHRPTINRPSVVHLDIKQKGGQVTVTPSDEDRFSISVERAIAACQADARAEEFKKQFGLLIRRLGEWLASRSDIDGAWITKRDRHLLFLVVRTSPEYDRDFEDALSALDLELAQDGHLDLIRISTMNLPPVSKEALSGFLDSELALPFAPAGRGKGR